MCSGHHEGGCALMVYVDLLMTIGGGPDIGDARHRPKAGYRSPGLTPTIKL